jgi:hypothetical protein
MTRSTAHAVRTVRRAAASGSGPTSEHEVSRFPAAQAGFALFGEVLLVGVLIFVVALPLVTLPIALAAGIRHLRRFLAAEDSALTWFWRDVRGGLLGSVGIGAVVLVLTGILLLDIDLASSGYLPGGSIVSAIGYGGLAILMLGLFTAAAAWSPESTWRAAVRAVPGRIRADVPGAVYLIATAVFAAVVTWQLAPLIVPALGCIAFAIIAVPERPRGGRRDSDEG